MSQEVNTGSKWRTNTHNLLWCHHNWWNRLFKIFKDKIRLLRLKCDILLEFKLNWLWYVSFFLMICLTAVMIDISFVTPLWCQQMLMSTKGSVCLQILCCYFIDVRLKLRYIKFALNWSHIKEIRKGDSNGFPPPPTYLK